MSSDRSVSALTRLLNQSTGTGENYNLRLTLLALLGSARLTVAQGQRA